MSNRSQSTLIELPPDTRSTVDLAADDYPAIRNARELSRAMGPAGAGQVNQELLDRALYAGDVFANYHIEGFVAAGGMGEIYVARRANDQGQMSKPLALKVLNNEAAGRRDVLMQLGREAKLCRSIHSRHVVRIYEYGLTPERQAFLSMELLSGEELFDRMAREKTIHIKALAGLAIEVLDGLHDVHAMGIVHRDIKPENIYLAKSRRWGEVAKILDFGLAKRVGEPDPFKATKELVGTPTYIAPEQIDSCDVDHRADLYSLGVILYQCAAGDPLFDRGTPYATMIAHQQEPPRPLPSTLDYEFCEIIYKALAKRPGDRWQSAMEMRQALDAWMGSTSWDEVFSGLHAFSPPAYQTQQSLKVHSTPHVPHSVPELVAPKPAAPPPRPSRPAPKPAPAKAAPPQPRALRPAPKVEIRSELEASQAGGSQVGSLSLMAMERPVVPSELPPAPQAKERGFKVVAAAAILALVVVAIAAALYVMSGAGL